MAVICDSLGAAVCSQPRPADPRVPTPIQPMLTRSLAPRTLWGASGPANAAAAADVFRKLRRVLSGASNGMGDLRDYVIASGGRGFHPRLGRLEACPTVD